MTLYERMTITIDAFTTTCIAQESSTGTRNEGVRGMIEGAVYARDECLSIEAAECVVF